MGISLPPLFKKRLDGHALETGIVHSAISTFGKWFETSRTVFFPDYTDHGPQHITNVLATAEAMIPREAVDVFSAADVTIFVLATLLHDSALHLAEPGFEEIIKGKASKRLLHAFDQTTWPNLWDEFLFTARRWNNERLKDVFGEEFVRYGNSVSNPFDRWGNLTSADFKLIGEFIRWHHPRLAHEFAVYDVPGTTTGNLKLPESVPQDWADLAGVVARSHGLPLRSCIDYISNHFHNKRDYQNIHVVYLMALLRIADYLQIDSARAPATVFQFRVLPSRISDLEWRTHRAIKNITPENEDPESVEINAEPSDVETFLRLRQWLDGIQNELDTSWAVLGEVYGRYERLKCLGLQWRRVRSNIDDVKKFAKTVAYVPRRVRVEVARAELLTLLIRPLYGDDPSYGVRELMQNAIDAVRERKFFQNKHREYATSPLREQVADVVIWLSDFDYVKRCAWIEFCDTGIGMTERVITDYFLTAGSSYRRSDEWQKYFERSDLPADPTKPRAQIPRTGRFGVGGLAAFLLSDEIEVETRHISSTQGFQFRFSLVDEAVKLERVSNLSVGTKIRLKITEDVFRKLMHESHSDSKPAAWDWYILDDPTVVRMTGNNRKILKQRNSSDLSEWRTAETALPLTVHWLNPDLKPPSSLPMLACNGIFVSDNASKITPKQCDLEEDEHKYWKKTPLLHVTDPDGHLGLDTVPLFL